MKAKLVIQGTPLNGNLVQPSAAVFQLLLHQVMKGDPGESPVISATRSGKVVTLKVNGTTIAQIEDGNDGQTPVITSSKAGGVTTIKSDGVTIATISDGINGNDGNGIASIALNADYTLTITFTNGQSITTGSIRGAEGQPGQDGHNPVISGSKSGKTTTIKSDGTPIATIEDGTDGQDGEDGQDGAPGPNIVSTTTDSNINGILKGASGKVAQAVAGSDYAVPTPVATPASASAYEIAVDTMTNLGTLTGAIALTLGTEPSDGKVHIYAFTFATGASAPTISWPSGISWQGGSAPTINANKAYEVSICQNKTLISEY